MAEYVRIYFVSGEKIDVPGPSRVPAQLVSGRGGLVTLKDRNGADVSVNPAHVTHVQGVPAAQPSLTKKPCVRRASVRYRYGDSNPGFRRERAAS